MQPFVASVLGFANAPAAAEQMASNLTMRHVLTEPGSAFGIVQNILTEWLKVDLTTMAAVVTLLGSLTGAIGVFQGIGVRIYWGIIKFLTASISVHGDDCLNREIIAWVSDNVLTRQGTRMLAAGTERVKDMQLYYDFIGRQQQEHEGLNFDTRVPVRYFPTFGLTFFMFERRPFMIKRIPTHGAFSARSAMGNDPDEYVAAPKGKEPLVVLCLGRSVAPIKRFFEACRNHADHTREKFVRVRASSSRYNRENWDTTVLRPLRPLATVHFDETTKDQLVDDIRNYLDPDTRHFYTERGIPYRRGYLLHGPPGTGKTSLSLALASRFKLDLYILHIPGVREDSQLEQLFAALPRRCIVLLEDIDAVGIGARKNMRVNALDKDSDDDSDSDDSDSDDDRDRSSKHSRIHSSCTLSGLLNVLDGVASQEGRIVLMTSNIPDKLDRALIRPGRVDRMIYLGNISTRSAELMFRRMFATVATESSGEKDWVATTELKDLAAAFAAQIPQDTFTPAQMQGYLLGHRSSPERAVADCARWVAEEKAILDETARRLTRANKRKERKRKEKRLAKQVAKELATKSSTEEVNGVIDTKDQDLVGAKGEQKGKIGDGEAERGTTKVMVNGIQTPGNEVPSTDKPSEGTEKT